MAYILPSWFNFFLWIPRLASVSVQRGLTESFPVTGAQHTHCATSSVSVCLCVLLFPWRKGHRDKVSRQLQQEFLSFEVVFLGGVGG